MITFQEYQKALQIVREFEEQNDPNFEAWDDDDFDERDWEEEEAEAEEERRMETASACTCGAWVINKNGQAVHIADCYCGAE